MILHEQVLVLDPAAGNSAGLVMSGAATAVVGPLRGRTLHRATAEVEAGRRGVDMRSPPPQTSANGQRLHGAGALLTGRCRVVAPAELAPGAGSLQSRWQNRSSAPSSSSRSRIKRTSRCASCDAVWGFGAAAGALRRGRQCSLLPSVLPSSSW